MLAVRISQYGFYPSRGDGGKPENSKFFNLRVPKVKPELWNNISNKVLSSDRWKTVPKNTIYSSKLEAINKNTGCIASTICQIHWL